MEITQDNELSKVSRSGYVLPCELAEFCDEISRIAIEFLKTDGKPQFGKDNEIQLSRYWYLKEGLCRWLELTHPENVKQKFLRFCDSFEPCVWIWLAGIDQSLDLFGPPPDSVKSELENRYSTPIPINLFKVVEEDQPLFHTIENDTRELVQNANGITDACRIWASQRRSTSYPPLAGDKPDRWGVASLEDIPEELRSALLRPKYIVEIGLDKKQANPAEYLRDMMELGTMKAYWPKSKQRAIVNLKFFPASAREKLRNPPPDEKKSTNE